MPHQSAHDSLGRCVASDLALNHDGPGHLWMKRAEVLVRSCGGQGERVRVIGIQGPRFESSGARSNCVRNVVTISPDHRGPRPYG